MRHLLIVTVFYALTSAIVLAQGQLLIAPPGHLNGDAGENVTGSMIQSLDALFSQIDAGKLDSNWVSADHSELTLSVLRSWRGLGTEAGSGVTNDCHRQLINLYPISAGEYFVSLACIGKDSNQVPALRAILNLVARGQDGKFTFSTPLAFLTRTWREKVVGNVTYYFPDAIVLERARLFDKKNTVIAGRLGLKPEKLEFYLSDNYQEALALLGRGYDSESSGRTRSGSFVNPRTIFAVRHNEDFSHDLFHYYAAQVRTAARNSTAEEGLAYSWGNAYWTKDDGGTITQRELVHALKEYLTGKGTVSLIGLFDENPKIFNRLAKEVSVKSTLSGLICDEVEKQRGPAGVKLLLNCGSGDDNYFRCIDGLIQINRTNFDKEVMKLVKEY